MTGDCHVRFCEQLGVKFPRLTRLSDTAAGANASALIYSIVLTAKANGLNVGDYLKTLLREIPILEANKTGKVDLTPLLPWNIAQPK
jgi:transposase